MSAALQARLKRLEGSARVEQLPLVLVVPRGGPLPVVQPGRRPVFFVITGLPCPLEVPV